MSASRRSSENPTKTNKREGSHSKSPALISVRLNEWPRTSSASTARRAGKGGWPAGAKSDGRFGKQDFTYLPKKDIYRCPAAAALLDNGMSEMLAQISMHDRAGATHHAMGA